MALLQTNARLAVQRRSYDSGSNQTSAPTLVPGLGSVPVFIQEKERLPRPADIAAEYELKVLWDLAYDIRDGDTLVGYNPANGTQPASLQVQHVATSGQGTPLACRSALTVAARYAPDMCVILRILGGTDPSAGSLQGAQQVATGVSCLIVPQAMEEYPTPAIPNQPQTRYEIKLPAGTDVRNNDILSLDGSPGQRLYVVIRTDSPRSYEQSVAAHCILSATNGHLGDAYLRPNATVRTTRAGWQVYSDRRVHLIYPQANPAAAIERLQGGVATLRIGVLDLVDADMQQGDSLEILSEDGPSTLPGVKIFTLAGVLRRPLPFCCCEIDALADIL